MTQNRSHNHIVGPATIALLASAAATGCAGKRVEFQQPVYGRSFWRHIATEPAPAVQDQFQIVADQPTQGLFPANLGVTRVAVELLDERIGLERRVLLTDPRNEFLRWNSALDDLFAISEVFPINEFDLGGGPVEPDQIIAAFRALHARIGLVYAMNTIAENRSEIIAVLYDNDAARPIAYFHAQATSIEPPEVDETEPSDLWRTDSEALVRLEFERMVHSCVRKLILQDEPAEVETPTGWRPVERRPVVWPPTQAGAGH
jgi:hypothetical protein